MKLLTEIANKYGTDKGTTFLPTVYGNKNSWAIGGENGEQDEINFYNNLSKNIMNYDTLYR